LVTQFPIHVEESNKTDIGKFFESTNFLNTVGQHIVNSEKTFPAIIKHPQQ